MCENIMIIDYRWKSMSNRSTNVSDEFVLLAKIEILYVKKVGGGNKTLRSLGPSLMPYLINIEKFTFSIMLIMSITL